MLSSIVIIIISIGISLLELPKMLKNKLTRESFFYLLILSIGTIGSILLSLEVELPNPVGLLTMLLKPLSNWQNHYLK